MTESPNAHPPVMRSAYVRRSPDEAWTVFTDEIGGWWPLPSHSVFGSRAGAVHFRGGQLVEIATDGSEAVWAQVLEWDPPARLALAWSPGRPEGPAGHVEVTFAADGDGTRVEIVHSGWEVFGDEAARWRQQYVGPSAWGHVLDHFAGGAEAGPEAISVDALEQAYADFFAEAEQGPFPVEPADGWNAGQVVAHVALNDIALSAVAHALIAGETPTFENTTCQQDAHLDAVVAAFGDMDGLVAFGRACAAQAVASVRRLNADQQQTAIACRLVHEGEVVFEGERPWAALAVDTQAAMHLPAHVSQLRDLRPPA